MNNIKKTMTENDKLIIPGKIFLTDFEKCQYLDESVYDKELTEMGNYQPNLLYLLAGANNSEDLLKSEKDTILRIFLTIWMLTNDSINMLQQEIKMEAVDKEFDNNILHFKKLIEIKDSKDLDKFIKQSFQGYRQKELYKIIFNLLLIENRPENSILQKDVIVFCYVKSYIDVIDKILNNEYTGTDNIKKNV